MEDNIRDVFTWINLCVFGVEKGRNVLSVRVPDYDIELVGRTDLLILNSIVKTRPVELELLPNERLKRQKLMQMLPSVTEDNEAGRIRESIEQYYNIASMLGRDIEIARAVARQIVGSIPCFMNGIVLTVLFSVEETHVGAKMDTRSQSFSHSSTSASYAHQNPPAQQSGQPHVSRSSPFASGPVAMVNQVRPGTGQFPGTAVRTTPTQLATPLVPQRRLSIPLDNSNVPLFPTNSTDSYQQSAAADHSDNSNHSAPLIPSPQPQQSVYSNLFGGPTPAPPFQVQAKTELYPRVERSAAESLFGVPSAPTPPGKLSQRSSYDNLFGPPPSEHPLTSPSAPHPPARSTQSFSYGQNTQFSLAQQQQLQQKQEQQAVRTFSQAPPPVAPFLGYSDNSSRSQSYRATTPLAASANTQSSAISPPPPVRTQRSSSGSLPLTTPPRVQVEIRSADDLLDEFLAAPVDAQFGDGGGAAIPPATKLMLTDVPDTVSGLEGLYKQKRWKTLTKKALSMLQNPMNNPKLTLEIKSWWLAGLIKDGHYDNATSVLDQIGDLDDPQYSSGSDSGRGCFVPIRLRLLEALLSKCKGQLTDHEKKLYQLAAKLQSALEESMAMELLGATADAVSRWLRIVQFALVNHLVSQQKFSLALRVCSRVEIESLPHGEKIIVMSRIGRLHLQMGDLTSAEKCFYAARTTHLSLTSDTTSSAHLEARLLLNDGLLLFAQNKLQEALSAFDSVLHLELSRSHQQQHNTLETDEQLFLEEDLVCAAVNNYAICALYCCDVKGAVAALERMIRSNPVRFLNAVVVFNLSSLYDLIFDNATSTSRKEMVKKIAELYDLEHIDPAAFRI